MIPAAHDAELAVLPLAYATFREWCRARYGHIRYAHALWQDVKREELRALRRPLAAEDLPCDVWRALRCELPGALARVGKLQERMERFA